MELIKTQPKCKQLIQINETYSLKKSTFIKQQLKAATLERKPREKLTNNYAKPKVENK